MRLGAPIFNIKDPHDWINKVLEKKYRAVYSPLSIESELTDFKPYLDFARKNDILIAEFGIWNNPLESNEIKRNKNIDDCKKSLFYADEIGANCTVNISGSRGGVWDGFDQKNLTNETFDKIVEVVRDIIDDVKPKRTFYTLETMPWMYPDSIESYIRLIKAIDRKGFAVHFDPVNLISSPDRYVNNGLLIKSFVNKLGKYIKSVHIKDIILKPSFMVHLNEVPPGTGYLDYKTLFFELSKVNGNLPVMLEHLNSEEEYDKASKYLIENFLK